MSEQLKGILASIVVLGCLALIGLMVWLKVDGAVTLGVSTVTILVAFYTNSTRSKGPPVPPGASTLVVVGGLAALVVAACMGCGGAAKTPREVTRSVVLTVADGVEKADKACASVALAKKDLSLATSCAEAYRDAREALLIAEDGVDAWDAAAASKLPCATKAALDALDRITARIEKAGGKLPPVVSDARKLATSITEACHG